MLPRVEPPCFARRMNAAGPERERAFVRPCGWGISSSALPALVFVSMSGCGGLVDTGAVPTEANGVGTGGQSSEGLGPSECPPTQWDCAGTPMSCDYVTSAWGEALPVLSISAACRCDFSRPALPTDCPENQLFVCGSLGWDAEPVGDQAMSFEPVSCRCAVNSGYYCSHCPGTGLYGSVEDAAGCGLDGNLTGGRSALFCGCGAQASP
jgi:hypothetical protein